jgi:serine/threonine protein kinase
LVLIRVLVLVPGCFVCFERNELTQWWSRPTRTHAQSTDSDSNIKLADFGFAKKCPTPESLRTQCGTPGYVAPEILEGVAYGTQADMWSLGVIVYILLGGYPPFIEQNQKELFRRIRKAQYKFHDEYWGQVSTEAKDLIKSLLTVDPKKRLDAGTIIASDKWINAGAEKLAEQDLGVNLQEFKKFNAKRKFKAAVKTVMATQKLTSLGVDFKENLE